MTMRVRAILMLVVAAGVMGLASCGHYICGANFGNSTCAAGKVSLTGGGTGSTAAAFVFVANGTASPGQMVGYTLNTSATPPTLTATPGLTPPATPGFDSGLGVAVAQKQFLYAVFGSTKQIFGWIISATGTLTQIQNTPLTLPSTFLSTSATSTFDTHRVAVDPAGTLLFIADENGSQIFVYQIGSAGILTAVTGSPFSLGAFSPGNLATDGLGNFLYITETFSNHTGDRIAAYSIGAGGNLGVLAQVSGSPFTFAMWQVQGEPTGQFLLGTTGMSFAVNGVDDNNLHVFSISPSGAIAEAVGSPFATTTSPFNIAAQTNNGGNLVYAFGPDHAGTGFNPVQGYGLSSSGTLSAENGSPFSNANVGDRGQFDQSGGLLFVYGGVTVNNTVAYTLTAFDVGSGSLTTPTATNTFGAFWVATDAP